MDIKDKINAYIKSHSDAKRSDMEVLHTRILQTMPGCKLWFLDGKNSEGKVVSNPNIGYGSYTLRYSDGTSREFYQIGLSANTTGISVYIMGIADKSYLKNTYSKTIGKASVTSYCIKFKAVTDIHLHILEQAIRDRIKQ